MEYQRNVTITIIALLTVILVWILCSHIEDMKILEIKLEELKTREHSLNEQILSTTKKKW